MVTVLNHPLINHKLTVMRMQETGTKDFRQNLDEIAGLMAYEITRDLKVKDVPIITPVCPATGQELEKKIVLVPILRAGLGMVDGIRQLIPTAKIGHIGLYRNEETLQPCEYFVKLPSELESSSVFVLDPMLATGGSAAAAITILKNRGAKDIKLICLVGVQEGIDKVLSVHPDVDVYLAAKDEKLNERGYIVPGLGDAGDRLFGTK